MDSMTGILDVNGVVSDVCIADGIITEINSTYSESTFMEMYAIALNSPLDANSSTYIIEPFDEDLYVCELHIIVKNETCAILKTVAYTEEVALTMNKEMFKFVQEKYNPSNKHY